MHSLIKDKKACIIAIQIGKMPEHFDLWLKSASYNTDYDFYIITDQQNIGLTEHHTNIKIINLTLEQLKEKVANFIGQEFEHLTYDNLKKLCDIRIIYGDLFSEIVENYKWYGWTDLDVVYGNFNNFLTEEVLQTYDCIGYISNIKKRLFGPFFLIQTKHKSCYKEIPNYKDLVTKNNVDYNTNKANTRFGGFTCEEIHLAECILSKKLKFFMRTELINPITKKKYSIPIVRNGEPRLPVLWKNGCLYINKVTRDIDYRSFVHNETFVAHIKSKCVGSIIHKDEKEFIVLGHIKKNIMNKEKHVFDQELIKTLLQQIEDLKHSLTLKDTMIKFLSENYYNTYTESKQMKPEIENINN
jgi:hypothetical protein